jgi:NitT/TauT family transport system ATP-binding protein
MIGLATLMTQATAREQAQQPRAKEQNANSMVHAELVDVTKVFNTVHALGPIDLQLKRGEFFSIVGPSGCGKSTLLDIWAGLSPPSSGRAIFEGQKVADVPAGIGVVFQEDASFPWLAVWDNIAFGLRRQGVDAGEIYRRVDYALSFMGLNEFRKSYPAQLSGGMRQRVCIARTLVTQPRFILLDEPFAALDQQTRLLMGEELLKLWRETKATVLLITHALDEASMLSDRVGVMSARPGRFIDLVETEWPAERDSSIVEAPEFGQISARLWKSLRKESLKALGEDRLAGNQE